MPFAGREILPRTVFGAIYDELVKQGVDEALEVALNLTATSMFEAGNYSKIRDQQRATLRKHGTAEADLPVRYWVLYEGATYENKDADGNVLSTDRGIFMLNDVHQPQATDAEAFNFEESAREAVTLYKSAGLKPWYGWRDVMSPDAIQKMRTDPTYPYAGHLEGATMRWRRAYLAMVNHGLAVRGMPLIPAVFFD